MYGTMLLFLEKTFSISAFSVEMGHSTKKKKKVRKISRKSGIANPTPLSESEGSSHSCGQTLEANVKKNRSDVDVDALLEHFAEDIKQTSCDSLKKKTSVNIKLRVQQQVLPEHAGVLPYCI